MVPPAGWPTGEWEGRETLGTGETPRRGPRPAEALNFLPREANDTSWAGEGVDIGPIKDHDLFPDSSEGCPKGGMSCEKAAKALDTKVRYGSFRVNAVLFGEQDPNKFLGASPPPVTPKSRKGRVPKGTNFDCRQGGDLNPVEGLGDGSGSNHFLLRTEGDGCFSDSASSTGPAGEAVCVGASDEGPRKVGMSSKDTMGIMDRDVSLEESSGGDFRPLEGGGSEGIAFLRAGILATDKKEALEKRDCLLDAGRAMARPGNDEGIITVLPVFDVWDRGDGPSNGSHYGVKL
jgi:hypothetical protein